ncbi:MAG: tripartite tricarboxylate transporter TctB family protein [Betaproteobacteria bacterium]
MTPGRLNRLAEGVVIAAIALVFVSMAVVAYGYSLTDKLGFGPGFFPFWLGVIGAALCTVLLVHAWRGHPVGEDGDAARQWPQRAGAARSAVLLAGLAAAATLLEPLGFRLTTLAFVALLLLALGARRAVPIALCALIASFALFHAFYHWLKVPLPIGRFGI